VHLADRTIQELSSGERQRVVFARALAQEPRALLLDEPTSFLDIRHQTELYDLVRELALAGGTAVLTVLHDLNLAAEYCDRIYLLREGRVAAAGRTDEVFTYANLTAVFETEVYVDTNDLTGQLLVVPLSGRVRRELAEKE
jgi:iron complex transport system ATP-binding protein